MTKIVYRKASNETSDRLQKEIGSILAAKGMDVSWIACRTMQALEYAIYKEGDAVVLVNERYSAEEAYGPWDIAGLCDIRKVRIVACVERVRYGTAFMAVLYASGIMDAVYEDDLDPRKVADLIQTGRSRGESRKYYGITSMEEVVSVLQVMDRDALERYVRYITSGIDREEMAARYQEVTKKLSSAEKYYLASDIPEDILAVIGETAMFKPPQAEKRGMFRFF